MSSPLRITGLASGIDVDSAVKKMMQAEQVRVDKLQQDRDIVQWKQDIYRDIIGELNAVKSSYFDVLNKDKYLLGQNSLANFDVTNADNIQNTLIPISGAGVGTVAGRYTVKVNHVAKPAAIKGNSIQNNNMKITDIANWQGKTIKINIGNFEGISTETSITLDPSTPPTPININELAKNINKKIMENDKLKNKISVSVNGTSLELIPSFGNTVKIMSNGTDDITDLNSLKDKVIMPTKMTKLKDLGVNEKNICLNVKYNGLSSSITIDNTSGDKTINDLITEVSQQTSGEVIAKYSELTGEFSLETLNMGSSATLSVEAGSTGTLLVGLGINGATATTGENAEVTITPPGGSATTVTRPSNVFTIDGINYNLQNQKVGDTTNVNVASNAQKSVDKIKDFVSKYNDLIKKIDDQISTKKQYKYKPLSDEQKKGMKEDEIKRWEAKAKEGLLANDSILQGMLYNMRNAFSEPVEGAGINLKDIGLSTSADYLQKGKIVIDERKLKEAVEKRGDQVIDLFAKSALPKYDENKKCITDYDPNNSYNGRTDRNKSEGIFQRINDILQDNIRITRDDDGKKGALLEKAGLKGDFSEIHNALYDDLKEKDKKILEMQRKLAEKETQYYNQFSKLEVAMQKANSQSSWLAAQLGGSN